MKNIDRKILITVVLAIVLGAIATPFIMGLMGTSKYDAPRRAREFRR